MLVLKRKEGQILVLTDERGVTVEVKLIEMAEGRAKLGIQAPKNINIMRKEVLDETKNENKEAMQDKKIDKNSLKNLKISKKN